MSQKNKPIIIAVDGHSSTGKSTMAKQLAKKLGYRYIDTGAMYRAVALYAMQEGLFDANNNLDEKALYKRLDVLQLRFDAENQILLNRKPVEHLIRSMDVSNMVSKVAKVPEVRHKLVAEQQAMGHEGGIVMDGRDIGSVVFPDAELKIFMTASAEVRATRRHKELTEKGDVVDFEEVLENIKERDYIDSTRAESPLVKTDDALVLDNSTITREEQLELAIKWAQERGA